MKLKDYLDRVDTRLSRIEGDLAEHMRRTELLEQAVVPLSQHVAFWGAAWKLVLGIGALVTLGLAVKQLFFQ